MRIEFDTADLSTIDVAALTAIVEAQRSTPAEKPTPEPKKAPAKKAAPKPEPTPEPEPEPEPAEEPKKAPAKKAPAKKAALKPEPAPEPEPVEEPAEDVSDLLNEARELAIEMVDNNEQDRVKEVLGLVGASRVSKMNREQAEKFLREIKG